MPNCRTCKDRANQCTSCNPLSSQNKMWEGHGICVSACPKGYVDLGKSCAKCESPCAECTATVKTCTRCDGTNRREVLKKDNTCHRDPIKERKRLMDIALAKPAGRKNCRSEVVYKKYYKGRCLPWCPDSTVDIHNTCEDCVSPCATCKGSTTNC